MNTIQTQLKIYNTIKMIYEIMGFFQRDLSNYKKSRFLIILVIFDIL